MTGDVDDLRRQFAHDLERGVAELTEHGYNAHYFRQMLQDLPADEVARRLVLSRQPSYGLWRLKELGRLDMSVEMWVLLPWYEELFGEDVRDEARRKLRLLDVDVAGELARLVSRLRPDHTA